MKVCFTSISLNVELYAVMHCGEGRLHDADTELYQVRGTLICNSLTHSFSDQVSIPPMLNSPQLQNKMFQQQLSYQPLTCQAAGLLHGFYAGFFNKSTILFHNIPYHLQRDNIMIVLFIINDVMIWLTIIMVQH